MLLNCLLVCVMYSMLSLCEAFDKSEGEPCTWGQFNGTCLDARRCYTFVYDKRDRQHPPICSFQGKVPIICCTECPELHADNISNALWSRNSGVEWKTGLKHKDACLQYRIELPYARENYVIFEEKEWDENRKCHTVSKSAISSPGRKDNRRAKFPYMALLGYGRDVDTAQWLCGGSLITSRFILTAAHCTYNLKLGQVRYIALGVWKRLHLAEFWQKHNILNVIPHPYYKPPSKYHDIALLETENRVEFTLGTLPACLHTGDHHNIREAIALSWGSLGPEKHLADILQKSELKSFTDEECADMFLPDRYLRQGFNKTTQMCFGTQNKPTNTCEGDSGGPLVLHRTISSVQDLIIGVKSYGIECGHATAGIYTRVDHYLPWITSIVWP